MRAFLFRAGGVAVASLVLASGLAGCQTANPPRTLSANFHHVTPEGWQGKRFTDNRTLLAEEYDTNGDGRLDLWRYYDQGRLVSEERDLMGQGGVNYVAAWTTAGTLLSAARDRQGRGTFDTQIEYLGNQRWRVAEDRNGDGFADRVLTAAGPAGLFRSLQIDLATVPSVVEAVPVANWIELRSDNAYTGTLGPAVRYRNGQPYERVLAYNAEGRPAQVERIPAGVDPDQMPVEPVTIQGGQPSELPSQAAADVRTRRQRRTPAAEEESLAGAVPAGALPRNMMFRAPGQL